MAEPEMRKVYPGAKKLARETGFSSSFISDKRHEGWSDDKIREYAIQQGRMKKPAPQKAKPQKPEPPRPAPQESTPMLPEAQESAPEPEPDAFNATIHGKTLTEWRALKEKSIWEKNEIANAVQLGELIPVAVLAPALTRGLAAFRDDILCVPGELADRLALETDPARIRIIMDERLRQSIRIFERLKEEWEHPLSGHAAA